MPESVFQCPFCSKKYRSLDSLKKHMREKEAEAVMHAAYQLAIIDLIRRLAPRDTAR